MCVRACVSVCTLNPSYVFANELQLSKWMGSVLNHLRPGNILLSA